MKDVSAPETRPTVPRGFPWIKAASSGDPEGTLGQLLDALPTGVASRHGSRGP